MLVIEPGTVLGRKDLVAVLHEAHDAQRETRDREIAERKKHGAPLEEDGVKVEPIAPFEAPADFAGIGVWLRIVSDAQRRDMLAGLADAFAELARAHAESQSQTAVRALSESVVRAQVAAVIATVARIDGLTQVDADGNEAQLVIDDVGSAIELLRRAGLLDSLFVAGRFVQELSPKKAVRCGRLLPGLSTSSSAVGAPAHADASSGATVAGAGIAAPSTRPTVARDASYSTTPVSVSPLVSLALSENGLAPTDNA